MDQFISLPQYESGLIVGEASEHGWEFVQLALLDYEHVFWANSKGEIDVSPEMKEKISFIQQDMYEANMAENILDEIAMFETFERSFPPLGLVVNLVEFKNEDSWSFDQAESNNPSISIPQLLELNELSMRKMLKIGGGEILNVLSRPSDCPDFVHEMFRETQALLMEIGDELNRAKREEGVHVHTLSYSPQSFALQSESLPPEVAHDMAPASCSAKDIADYGYQVLRVSRSHA